MSRVNLWVDSFVLIVIVLTYMMEIKSVDLKSLLKIGFVFYLLLMLVVGVIGLFFLLFNLVTNFSPAALGAVGGAVLVYLLMSLVYALVAALIFGLSGLIYNKLAERFGGVKVELEKLD